MEKLLVVENVSKSFGGFKALDQVSLSIPKAGIFGLLGPNGAGKTTLLRIINQITIPDRGRILFDGKPLRPEDIVNIGYMPEERGLYKSMKVGEQAMYLARLKGLTKFEAQSRLQHWFEKLNIQHWWDKKIHELSKGMAQKVQFVVTVLHQPKLLIFDEPFSGFDPVNAALIKDEILQLKEAGATILFATHRMESVEELCEHIALLNKSKKIIEGRVSDIKRQYKSNSFQVGISTDAPGEAQNRLSRKFKVSKADFKSIHEDLKLIVQLENATSPNDLLHELTACGRVNHFVEVIPSMNDIFIKSVMGQ